MSTGPRPCCFTRVQVVSTRLEREPERPERLPEQLEQLAEQPKQVACGSEGTLGASQSLVRSYRLQGLFGAPVSEVRHVR